MDADAVAKLSPAERERYDAWQERTAALHAGASTEHLGHPRLVGVVLGGPAGEAVHGVSKPPKVRDPIEDPAAWEEQRRNERAARDAIRAEYLSPARRPVRIARVATSASRRRARWPRSSPPAACPHGPTSSTAPSTRRSASCDRRRARTP